jgi:hypothetical protein
VLSFVGVCLLTLAGLQLFVLPVAFSHGGPSAYTFLEGITSELFATLAAALVAALFLLWLYPETERGGDVEIEIITSENRSKRFKSLRAQTTSWRSSGGLGRWVSVDVLPVLARKSRHEGQPCQMYVVILDPRDSIQCDHYASHRMSTRRGSRESWSRERVQEELWITIHLFAESALSFGRLEVNLALKQSFSTLRFDLCDDGAFLTREDPRHVSMYVPRTSVLWSMFDEKVTQDYKSSVAVDLRSIVVPLSGAQPGDRLAAVMEALEFEPRSDEYVAQIVKRASQRKSPYR